MYVMQFNAIRHSSNAIKNAAAKEDRNPAAKKPPRSHDEAFDHWTARFASTSSIAPA